MNTICPKSRHERTPHSSKSGSAIGPNVSRANSLMPSRSSFEDTCLSLRDGFIEHRRFTVKSSAMRTNT